MGEQDYQVLTSKPIYPKKDELICVWNFQSYYDKID